MLPDKQVMYGVLDLKDHAVETPQIVAARLRQALGISGRNGSWWRPIAA